MRSTTTPPRPPVTVSIPRHQLEQLDAIAEASGRPRSRVVERLLDAGLAADEPGRAFDDYQTPDEAAQALPLVQRHQPALDGAWVDGFEAGLRRAFCGTGTCTSSVNEQIAAAVQQAEPEQGPGEDAER